MKRFITEGDGLPTWQSPISHAVVVGNTCYLSGQLSVSAEGEYIPGTVQEEAERAFSNLFNAVRASGFSAEDLVFVDIVLADIFDIQVVNLLYAELFPVGRRPARTFCQAAALPFGARVKVMGVAVGEPQS
ncbi:translation initiation inhibitor [Lysobacter daejeonensis GH1-9]|uniref:Translation initiation inhibitor n=1 Tax=Lysobacter daejeonensis GH1-9 TaxID=1385517 RepID=A0A0A0F0C7_9GAMM|nr:RidA family protein [Lysobacter daejeonensis]KGM56229.1 translation initiation inhibitor [Lysobacter daejeonensis GH1-9]